jgi:hypothetical protein
MVFARFQSCRRNFRLSVTQALAKRSPVQPYMSIFMPKYLFQRIMSGLPRRLAGFCMLEAFSFDPKKVCVQETWFWIKLTDLKAANIFLLISHCTAARLRKKDDERNFSLHHLPSSVKTVLGEMTSGAVQSSRPLLVDMPMVIIVMRFLNSGKLPHTAHLPHDKSEKVGIFPS